MLDAIRGQLVERGLGPEQIDLRIERKKRPRRAIIDAATSYDAVVMGEYSPSLVTFVLGMADDDVAEQFLGPVVVIQRDKPAPSE